MILKINRARSVASSAVVLFVAASASGAADGAPSSTLTAPNTTPSPSPSLSSSSSSRAKNRHIKLHFDPHKSIGCVFMATHNSTGARSNEGKKTLLGDARGTYMVDVPPGQLIHLDLGRGAFESPQLLDQVDIASIDALKISYISLDENDAEVFHKLMEHLKRFKNVTIIDFDRSDADDSSFSLLRNMPGLRIIGGFSSLATGICFKDFSKLSNLQHLQFDLCRLTDNSYTYLPAITSLRGLSISATNLSGSSLGIVSQCSGLEALRVSGNRKIDDPALAQLAKLHNLTFLDVRGCRVTLKGLESLKQLPLTHVVLDNTMVPIPQRAKLKELFPKTTFSWFDNEKADVDEKFIFAPLH